MNPLLVGRLACIVAALAAAGAGSQAPLQRPRVILLSVDAGTDWIADELLARGRAPALAAMAREGVRADAMVTVLPTLTAVSHTSLWTGAWPREHGITGNHVPMLPRAAHTVLEWRSGFENDALLAEPIWEAAARQGRRTLVIQATGGFPFSRRYPDRLLQFDTYANPLVPGSVVEGTLEKGTHRFHVGDVEATLTRLGSELALDIGGARHMLAPGRGGRFTPPIEVWAGRKHGFVRLRLIRFDRAGRFTLLRGRVDELTSSDAARIGEFRAAAGTIVGENISRPYARGLFGTTVAENGDGTAEDLVLQALAANQEYFTGALSFAAKQPWDLLVLYIPNFDAAGHAFVGMIDPDSPAYTPAVAGRAWPWVERAFEALVDAYVGELRRRFADASLVVVADHGMEGSGRVVHANVALRKAGLLALDSRFEVDLARTRAVHLADSGGGVFINTTDWKGGAVPRDRLDEAKRHVTTVLLAIRDPHNDRAPIRAVFDTDLDGVGLGIGGEGAADLYFDLAPGYESTASLAGDAEVTAGDPAGAGDHGNAPFRRKLHAFFFAAGPLVVQGRQLGVVRTIDVAATVAKLAGIEPPRDSVGVALPILR